MGIGKKWLRSAMERSLGRCHPLNCIHRGECSTLLCSRLPLAEPFPSFTFWLAILWYYEKIFIYQTHVYIWAWIDSLSTSIRHKKPFQVCFVSSVRNILNFLVRVKDLTFCNSEMDFLLLLKAGGLISADLATISQTSTLERSCLFLRALLGCDTPCMTTPSPLPTIFPWSGASWRSMSQCRRAMAARWLGWRLALKGRRRVGRWSRLSPWRRIPSPTWLSSLGWKRRNWRQQLLQEERRTAPLDTMGGLLILRLQLCHFL